MIYKVNVFSTPSVVGTVSVAHQIVDAQLLQLEHCVAQV
jgi:hypothetical protein